MRVIDFRGRPATPEFASSQDNRIHRALLAARYRRLSVETVAEFVARMDRLGVMLAVVPGRDIETTFGWKVSNEHVADIVRQYPDRFVGFAGIDPNKGVDALREVRRCVRELGLRGVSLDPYMHKRPLNDKRYYPIYAACVELAIPVVFTTASGRHIPETVMQHATPMLIDEVATDFPDLVLIASHGCYPYVLEMIAVAGRHENVYLELSGYATQPGSELYVQAANAGVIADRLMFASAHPFQELDRTLEDTLKLPYTDEVRAKVLYDNAARLLGV